MKFLFISEDSIKKPIGGLGVFLGEYIPFLVNKGHKVHICCPDDASEIDTNPSIIQWKQFQQQTFGVDDIMIWLESVVQGTISIASRAADVDVIVSFDNLSSFIARNISLVSGKPYIYYSCLSNVFFAEDAYKKLGVKNKDIELMKDIQITNLLNAKKIITVSKTYAERFPKIMWPKITVIPNSLELSKWKSQKRVQLPGKRSFSCMFIGRIITMKGIRSIFETKIPETMDFYIAGGPSGDGELFLKMKRFVEAEPNRYHLGYVSGQDKIDLYHSVDFVLMPSIHEPFGIVALEAIASGCILICPKSIGALEFLKESYTIECDVDPASITKALEIASKMDRETIDEISKKNRTTVTHLDNYKVFEYLTMTIEDQ